MIQVGFSMRPKNYLSRLIRWFTGSKVSHTWLLVDETFFGMKMVMEASEFGFRLIPYEAFKANGNEIVVLVDPPYPLDVGVRAAGGWFGERYNFTGLFGTGFVLLGRWLRRKWSNPLAEPHSMFCSEAIVWVLRTSSFPGADTLDPPGTTPQDLLDFFVRAGHAPTGLASS